ncbi:hypothetical protein K469DRAFT_695276 [Zopfia rhizophila CBS 207.26]|uniref:Uncharacterized protein n=1 Tax=Zopfia rhizophila CBS 207.26 TaxID=1314779 RepID=A0A6A6DI08_9PEZI|nr:hypothetical protein K469DRAFT_695276 [Zopfia rhizophila CBS 207.26]
MADGLRSSAPLLVEGMLDVKTHYKTFWESGTCFKDKEAIQECAITNPTFAYRRGELTLHYGTNPLLGFHLALKNTELSVDPPLRVPEIIDPSINAALKSMRTVLVQLEAWCKAFRSHGAQVTIRYINSDAISFCHVLQHQCEHKESLLDSADYNASGHAPTSFDVIDTSNLMDHLGSLNLLTAASPLLCSKPFSTLRTEMLVPRESNVADSAKPSAPNMESRPWGVARCPENAGVTVWASSSRSIQEPSIMPLTEYFTRQNRSSQRLASSQVSSSYALPYHAPAFKRLLKAHAASPLSSSASSRKVTPSKSPSSSLNKYLKEHPQDTQHNYKLTFNIN